MFHLLFYSGLINIKPRKQLLVILSAILAIAGLIFLFLAFKIEIKARVAQYLLNNAWNKTIETGDEYEPWPGFDGYPILKLKIPKFKLQQIVLSNTSGQSLAFGPSFHPETYLPKENKITAISSHRDSHGYYIRDLKINDFVILEDKENNKFTYKVKNFKIINVENKDFQFNKTSNQLLLITCYPLDAIISGTKLRYIVTLIKT